MALKPAKYWKGEQSLTEGVPEAQFSGDATAEPAEDAEPFGPLKRGGEAEKQLGLR